MQSLPQSLCAALQVAKNDSLPPLTAVPLGLCWTTVLCASAGLVLLYRITVSDPGFLPRSTGSSSAARSNELSKRAPTKAPKQPLDQILGRWALSSGARVPGTAVSSVA